MIPSSNDQTGADSKGMFIWSQADPVKRDDSFNKAFITALINIQNDISKLK
jgi:hypothetical protein